MAAVTVSEAERLGVLHALQVLDTPPEPHFDALCRVAQAVFSTPVALVTLIDTHRQWFKAACGTDLRETPREVSFCTHALSSDEVLVIEDLTLDPRTAQNPLVTGEPHVRFYAGAPLVIQPGVRVGTLCIVGMAPRTMSEAERAILRDLAEVASTYLRQAPLTAVRSEVVAQEVGQSSLERLRLAVELTGLGSWDHCLRTETRYWSKEMREILGIPPEQALTPTTFLDLVYPDDRPWVADLYYERLAETPDEGYRTELRVVRACDGAVRWIVMAGRRFLDETGKAVRSIGTILDVTDERQQALELVASKQAAEAASLAKSEFLAAMSHEIRTPLNGVLGYADILLQDERLLPDQRTKLQRIETAGAALLTVVDDVLSFSSIEAGQTTLDVRPFSPARLVADAVAILEAAAQRAGLDLVVTVSERLPAYLLGDESRLRQVLLNLLNNAVKFTPQGRVTVELSWVEDAGAAPRLRVTVADTGIGIPVDRQHRLFQHFSQVDGSIRRRFGGTGLGLAISKRLIELMDGEIGVESEGGEGATFWFEVPLAQAEQTPVPAVLDEAGQRARSVRILLVEDNELNQEIAASVLQAAGHEVDVAPDGAVAVRMVEAGRYDVVLMDVQMPVMDGITATQRIRALQKPRCDLPIIAMTANVLPKQVEAFRAAGMNDHIGKPFRREELYAAIERWTSPQHT